MRFVVRANPVNKLVHFDYITFFPQSNHRYQCTIYRSRNISLQKSTLIRASSAWSGHKKAVWPTRKKGFLRDVLTLTVNILAVATSSTNKTKQGRLAGPLTSQPKQDVYESCIHYLLWGTSKAMLRYVVEAILVNKSYSLAAALGVTKFVAFLHISSHFIVLLKCSTTNRILEDALSL